MAGPHHLAGENFAPQCCGSSQIGGRDAGRAWPGWNEIYRRLCGASSRMRIGFGVLLLFALVFLIYRPILPGTFVMDDEKLIQWDNPIVNGTLGPFSVWFRAD